MKKSSKKSPVRKNKAEKKGKRKMESKPQPLNFFPEVSFIICRKRKNQPKVSPSICEQRCQRMKGCREYFDYLQPAMFSRSEKRDAKGREE